MKYTVTNSVGEQIELDLTSEQAKSMGVPEHMIIRQTGYERVPLGERYWIYNGDSIMDLREDGDLTDNEYYTTAANYYSSSKVAWANHRADTLLRKLRQYAAEHGGITTKKDWADSGVCKYFIAYQEEGGFDLFVESYCAEQFAGVVYFKDKQACWDAIKMFHDELIWYFTKYEPMLYEE